MENYYIKPGKANAEVLPPSLFHLRSTLKTGAKEIFTIFLPCGGCTRKRPICYPNLHVGDSLWEGRALGRNYAYGGQILRMMALDEGLKLVNKSTTILHQS